MRIEPIRQLFDSAANVEAGTDAAGQQLGPTDEQRGQDRRQDQRPGDQADLPLELPALRTPADLTTGLLPGQDPALQDPEVVQADTGQGLLGLGRADPGAAHAGRRPRPSGC